MLLHIVGEAFPVCLVQRAGAVLCGWVFDMWTTFQPKLRQGPSRSVNRRNGQVRSLGRSDGAHPGFDRSRDRQGETRRGEARRALA